MNNNQQIDFDDHELYEYVIELNKLKKKNKLNRIKFNQNEFDKPHEKNLFSRHHNMLIIFILCAIVMMCYYMNNTSYTNSSYIELPVRNKPYDTYYFK